ncbi:glycosyl hydrolase family 95 catalytic domain-containing protein, partial [Pseudomonas putida]|uniref:glycosyl hydrolase family 95 catalytic domain-containing protein n=1 Tax=Pseudomonas putida TaxID=303 RepID=UPI003132B6F9
YTRDQAFLAEQGWPIVREAARFCLAWLVEMPGGTLGTSPSTSPENHFLAPDGEPAAATVSTTADLVLIRDLFTQVGRLHAALPAPATEDTVVADRARAALTRIPAERIAPDGRIAEWPDDRPDAEPAHRHTSH